MTLDQGRISHIMSVMDLHWIPLHHYQCGLKPISFLLVWLDFVQHGFCVDTATQESFFVTKEKNAA